MEFAFEHHVLYAGTGVVSVDDIVRSLQGGAALMARAPRLIEALYPDVEVVGFNFELRRVRHESPVEEYFQGRIALAAKRKLEQYVDKIGKATGMTTLSENKSIISWIVVGAGFYGLGLATSYVFPDRETVNIQGDNNVVINLSANATGLPPEEIRSAIETALAEQSKRALARDATRFIAPAKESDGTGIVINGEPLISAATIFESPTLAQLEGRTAAERILRLRNEIIEIRATDLDQKRRGWAAVIPSLSAERVLMQISPFVDPIELRRHQRVRADIDVHIEPMMDGELRPVRVDLINFNGPA